MNYINEINSFYTWLIANPISGNAQALWHRLMAYCNAFGWEEEFTIPNTRLVADLGISRQEVDRIRNILVQKGLITYKKGNGNQCGTYHINPFVTQNITQDITQNLHSCLQGTLQGCLPLNKLNKTKLNNKNISKDISKEKFKTPTVLEVEEYCKEVDILLNAVSFCDYYASKGWLVGKSPMKDWKAAARNWARREQGDNSKSTTQRDINQDNERNGKPKLGRVLE